jgi:ferredoxin
VTKQAEENDRERPKASEAALHDEKSADLPTVDSLDEKSDFSMFLLSGVREKVRKRALRKLFHLPFFHQRNGLDDYDEDYRSFHHLGSIVTAHLRHQLKRQGSKMQEGVRPVQGQEAWTIADSTQSADPVTVKFKGTSEEKQVPPLLGYELEQSQVTQKPPEACAHGSSSFRGCSRCLDNCPTQAIVSFDNCIQIDTNICEGCGLCVAVCPSGCMTTAEPLANNVLKSIRSALLDRHNGGEERVGVFLYDGRIDTANLSLILNQAPQPTIVFPLENTGVVGMDVWLMIAAYGARDVYLLVAHKTPEKVLQALANQLTYAAAVLEGMGYSGNRLKLIQEGGELQFPSRPAVSEIPSARLAPTSEKRAAVDLAVAHLHKHAPTPRSHVSLPEGAPYGKVRIKKKACTLCMACVAVCPAGSLVDGGGRPELRFIEANCVQCGLCREACPENAIRLSPRFVYDRESARQPEAINKEEIFCCIECGEPFATQKMVDRIAAKLTGHWMYQGEEEKRRLQMCTQCRVRDVFQR